MTKRALLLINPRSRSGRDHHDAVKSLLENKGFNVAEPVDANPLNYAETIRQSAAHADFVVVGGGDGSINLALPGLLDTDLPLGVLPLGTANNFARNIGLPLTPDDAVDVIAKASLRRVDVATVNERPFLNVSGLGLSTEVNRHLPSDLKKKWGMLAYVIYALKVVRRMRPFHVDISCDGEKKRVRTFQVTICNGRFYGPGLTIAHDAQIDDGTLDLASTEVDVWWKGLRCVPSLVHGDYSKIPEMNWLRGRSFEISTRKPLWIDADGEMIGKTPARYDVDPRGLRVFVP